MRGSAKQNHILKYGVGKKPGPPDVRATIPNRREPREIFEGPVDLCLDTIGDRQTGLVEKIAIDRFEVACCGRRQDVSSHV
jgi:hypothetical protein